MLKSYYELYIFLNTVSAEWINTNLLREILTSM